MIISDWTLGKYKYSSWKCSRSYVGNKTAYVCELSSEDTRGVMVIAVGNGNGYSCSNLDDAVFISYSVNIVRKGMHSTIFPKGMTK